ncbi:GNAT family N-acetyltransferase [Elizabethkingia sp. JS20170427COW]|uniref:GNAT family N-acetyltransferase n=1 Tax=Elizabethkingia sp. JS20170427COW TaxID=2583851 RepID=UPI0016235C93|nr:GNAT family protein [Elizabethkingia sp. JS20170427COW]
METLELKSERLILSPPQQGDIATIISILGKDKVYFENTLNIPFPYTAKNAEFWLQLSAQGLIEKTQYIFAIRLINTRELIGGIDLGIDRNANKAELGYWLSRENWNKGYATEAVKLIINFGFTQLRLRRIYASHFDFNMASGKVLEKSGMQKEGVLRSHTFKEGKYQDHIIYAIINE